MEVDTGAAVSIMSEEPCRKVFPEACLRSGSVLLRTYTGGPMVVAGQMDVQVKYASNSYILPLMVVAGRGPSLFGRGWLHHVHLDGRAIGLVTLDKGTAQLQGLLQKYQEVFAEQLGTMRHVTHGTKLLRSALQGQPPDQRQC